VSFVCACLCLAENCWFLVETATSFAAGREPEVSGRIDGLLFLRCPGLHGLNLGATNLDTWAQEAITVGLGSLMTLCSRGGALGAVEAEGCMLCRRWR
jgi:hypothetical protein